MIVQMMVEVWAGQAEMRATGDRLGADVRVGQAEVMDKIYAGQAKKDAG